MTESKKELKNIWIPIDLHKKLKIRSAEKNTSMLNELCTILKKALDIKEE
jgi:plasmid stability protein